VAVLFGEGVAGTEVEALEEIAGGDAGFDLERNFDFAVGIS